jgi:hypothetical protein
MDSKKIDSTPLNELFERAIDAACEAQARATAQHGGRVRSGKYVSSRITLR